MLNQPGLNCPRDPHLHCRACGSPTLLCLLPQPEEVLKRRLLGRLRRQLPSLSWFDCEEIWEEALVCLSNRPLADHEWSARQLCRWMSRILYRRGVDALRLKGRQPLSHTRLEDEGIDSPVAALLQRESADRLHARLQELSETEQELLRLRFSEDLRYREIAVDLQIPDGTVASRLSRLLTLLREKLTAEE